MYNICGLNAYSLVHPSFKSKEMESLEEKRNYAIGLKILGEVLITELVECFKREVKAQYGHEWTDREASGKWLCEGDENSYEEADIEQLRSGDTLSWGFELLCRVLLESNLCLLEHKVAALSGREFQLKIHKIGKKQVGTVISFACNKELDLRMFFEQDDHFRLCMGNDTILQCTVSEVQEDQVETIQVYTPMRGTGDIYRCQKQWQAVSKLHSIWKTHYSKFEDDGLTRQEFCQLVCSARNTLEAVGTIGNSVRKLDDMLAKIHSIEVSKVELGRLLEKTGCRRKTAEDIQQENGLVQEKFEGFLNSFMMNKPLHCIPGIEEGSETAVIIREHMRSDKARILYSEYLNQKNNWKEFQGYLYSIGCSVSKDIDQICEAFDAYFNEHGDQDLQDLPPALKLIRHCLLYVVCTGWLLIAYYLYVHMYLKKTSLF